MGKNAILRKEIRQLRRDLRKADLHSTDLRFRAVERNTDLANRELRGRLKILNELRGDVVSRGEYTTKINSLETLLDTKVTALTERIDLNTQAVTSARGGGRALDRAWGYLIGALGILLVAVDAYLRASGH